MDQIDDFGELMRSINNHKEEVIWDYVKDISFNIDTYFPSPGIINGYRATCLGHACSIGNIALVKACLNRGANVYLGSLWHEKEVISNKIEPCVIAAGRGDSEAYEIVCELEKAGTFMSLSHINKMLMEAVWPLSTKLVKWCLNKGADPNFISYVGGPTVLSHLCYRWDVNNNEKYIKVAALLLYNGADPSVQWSGPSSSIERICDWKHHLRRQLYGYNKEQEDEIIQRIETMASLLNETGVFSDIEESDNNAEESDNDIEESDNNAEESDNNIEESDDDVEGSDNDVEE